jgi:hypothetical protein
MIENEASLKVKCLRSNNEGEYDDILMKSKWRKLY